MSEAKKCKKCGAVYPISSKKCPFCNPVKPNPRMISVLYGPPTRFRNICKACGYEWSASMLAEPKCPKCGETVTADRTADAELYAMFATKKKKDE